MKAILSLLISLTAVIACAAPRSPSPAGLPPAVLPEGVGVNIHFTRGHERDLDLIAAAGFKFIRMDFSWSGTERKQGEYDWTAYEELTANLERRRLRALYILDYSNALYEETVVSRNPITGAEQRATASPQRPESVAAFARWAAAAAKHFQGRGILWEIWNEPNISFWKPKPDVAQYGVLAQATVRAIRAMDPQATIIAPASSGFPWEFLERLFESGLLAELDAVSVHPYRGYSQGPETAGVDYLRLRALIEQHAPAGKRFLPIVSGEWGYATQRPGGVSLETQAAFIARQQLANLYHGVPLSIWYDWKNDGTQADYHEHNFGTVTHELVPKPSYRAVAALTRELGGCRIARRLTTGRPDEYVLLLVNAAGNQKLAAWTTGEPRRVTFPWAAPAAGGVRVVDGLGAALEVQRESGRLALSLQPLPQYVSLAQPVRELAAAACWEAGPVQSRVVAGETDAVVIPVSVRNPFPERMTIDVRLRGGMEAASGWRRTLDPGAEQAGSIKATVTRRWPATVSAELAVEIAVEAEAGESGLLGQWTEPFYFQVANPLNLHVAPVVGGLQVRLTNPGRQPFTGTVRAGERELAVRLRAEQPEVTLTVEERALPGGVEVRDAAGRLVAALAVPRFESLKLERGRAVLDGDAQVPATASLALTKAPGNETAPYPEAWQLDYKFATGWRFVRAVIDAPAPEPLERQPRALGLWVHGDGSGNSLRMRLRDAAGQTFQPNGPELGWTGWRWVEFDVADLKRAGHWGGAGDGVARGALQLDTLLLVDGTRDRTAGRIHLAGPAWIYE